MSDKKVILATWIGGAAEVRIDGITLIKDEQQKVPAATAKRLETEFPSQCVVVHTTEGSADDVRKPPYVVPVQPDEPDGEVTFTEPPAGITDLSTPLREADLDQHDSTPLDPNPHDEKE